MLLSRRRDPEPLDELTGRERGVLALTAEGLADRAIVERLWISTSNVEAHVRHILQKLELPCDDGKNRRVQAVLIHLRAYGLGRGGQRLARRCRPDPT